MSSRIAVLGTGRMGAALVRAFLKQGHATHVWNRTRSRGEPLAALGARIADTVLDAVTAADIIVSVVNTYDTSGALLSSPDVAKALRGKTVVELTSGSPRLARERAAWAASAGVDYLDGAIMATPDFIGGDTTTILYAGSPDLFARHEIVLRALGGNAVHVGADVGHASALDSALLIVMWGGLFGVLQGAAIVDAEGIPRAEFTRHVKAVLPMMDGALIDLASRIEEGRVMGDATTLASLESHYGAFKHLLELCADRGIHRVVPDAFREIFEKGLAAGHAEDDFAVLHRFVR